MRRLPQRALNARQAQGGLDAISNARKTPERRKRDYEWNVYLTRWLGESGFSRLNVTTPDLTVGRLDVCGVMLGRTGAPVSRVAG